MRQRNMTVLLCLLAAALLLTACGSKSDREMDSYDAWVDKLGYTPNTPASLPGKDFNETYAIEDGGVAKATYSSPDQVIIYRTVHEEDRELIAFEGLAEVGKSTCKGFDIPLYGTEEGAQAAQWSEGGKTFAVYFNTPVTEELFDEFIMYI